MSAYEKIMIACIDSCCAIKTFDNMWRFLKDKESITAAEDFATKAGKTLPMSAYENAMNACVDEAAVFASGGDWIVAETGIIAAEDFATKAGKTLLASDYEKVMNAYGNKVGGSARYEHWTYDTKQGITTAKYFAKKSGKPLSEQGIELAAKLRTMGL